MIGCKVLRYSILHLSLYRADDPSHITVPVRSLSSRFHVEVSHGLVDDGRSACISVIDVKC